MQISGDITFVGGDSEHYSETRVAVPKGNAAKWLFPQEKATSETLFEGTMTLVSL
jgi:hypothetical protein